MPNPSIKRERAKARPLCQTLSINSMTNRSKYTIVILVILYAVLWWQFYSLSAHDHCLDHGGSYLTGVKGVCDGPTDEYLPLWKSAGLFLWLVQFLLPAFGVGLLYLVFRGLVFLYGLIRRLTRPSSGTR